MTVERGGATWEGRGVVLLGAERDALFAAVVKAVPTFGRYQERTQRTIPVVELCLRSRERAACGAGGVMAWGRGAGKGREGAQGVDVDDALDIGNASTGRATLSGALYRSTRTVFTASSRQSHTARPKTSSRSRPLAPHEGVAAAGRERCLGSAGAIPLLEPDRLTRRVQSKDLPTGLVGGHPGAVIVAEAAEAVGLGAMTVVVTRGPTPGSLRTSASHSPGAASPSRSRRACWRSSLP